MRQGTRKGLMTVAAATGVIAAVSGYAHADADASGTAADSPGVLSGNTVQVPVHVPVNVCGNTANVVGLLNPAVGNTCANHGGGQGSHGSGSSHARGHTSGSPGVGSGDTVQAPVDVPVDMCGNSVNLIGVGNPTTGDECANGGGHDNPPGQPGHPGQPGTPHQPGKAHHPGSPATPPTPPAQGGPTPQGSVEVDQPGGGSAASATTAQLAHTGSELPLGGAVAAGAGALLAGAVLYRKARTAV